MVPVVGFELTTYRLQGGCSTTELNRHLVSDARIELAPHAPKARMIPFHQSEFNDVHPNHVVAVKPEVLQD